MITKQLLETMDKIYSKLDKELFWWLSDKEKTLLCSVKLNEETWELSAEVLKKLWKWRKEKLNSFDENNLKLEVADVIFSVLVLAKSLNIDINEALSMKLKKIEDRGWF